MATERICYLTYGVVISLGLAFGPIQASAATCSGEVLAEGSSCSSGPDIILPPGCDPPPGCPAGKLTAGCVSGGISYCNCDAMPNMHVASASDGTLFCVPDKPDPSCPKILDASGTNPACRRLKIRLGNAVDPNDKVGTLGVSDQEFIGVAVPLNYAIHFENLSTATAPAQIVVVTDQLDAQRMDLGTFQLGPITFSAVTLVPQAGAQTFTGGVDLSLEQDLQVVVTATLDKSTGLVTWRFTSIDPATGQLTDDPDAGFLPPNVSPPAGEGTVVFSVMPKSALATGTAIQNQAQVVFDTNAPIATPTWLNTIDKDAPVTHVLPLAATQSTSTFPVQWTGTDAGSGVGAFRVLVADNGGPFTTWLDSTTAVSGNFTGQVGHTYRFFSIGTDLVGNVEPAKTVAEATTQVVSAPACAADVSNQVQITRSGYGYNLLTRRFVQTVTLKNAGGSAITGPVSLVLDALSAGATLSSPTGATACAGPMGSPYVNITGNLSAGASAALTLQFTDPTRTGITYATRVLAGTQPR